MLRQRCERRCEPRKPLCLRAAVHSHDDRKRAFAFRLEEEDRHPLSVEALEAVERRLDQRRRIDVTRARREPLERLPVEVVQIHVVRLDRAREREGEERAVFREDRLVDHAAAGQQHALAQLERLRVP